MEESMKHTVEELQREIAELADLILQTGSGFPDPDICWARNLFFYRMGQCRERLGALASHAMPSMTISMHHGECR